MTLCRIFVLPWLLLVTYICSLAVGAETRADSAAAPTARGEATRTTLNVAIFAFLPDAASAIEGLEEAFEQAELKQGRNVDLDLELWDPYRDEVKKDGIDQISRFDVVEIDVCRIQELLASQKWALDEVPEAWRPKPESFVEPAATFLRRQGAKYAIPHWVCGNFFVCWADNQELTAAQGLDDILAALDPSAGKPLLADLYGSTGLGEFYADALLDQLSADEARKHLTELADVDDAEVAGRLVPSATDAIVRLAQEMRPDERQNLDYLHDLNFAYPREFAGSKKAALIGYSERLYHVERELQLTPKSFPPIVQPKQIVVRPFPFGKSSKGTPTWVDAFVVPKGRLATKHEEIRHFLEFVMSDAGYSAFIEPTKYQPASYLLPATLDAYDGDAAKKQPALDLFRDQLDATFLIDDAKIWRGMRKAGGALEAIVLPPTK